MSELPLSSSPIGYTANTSVDNMPIKNASQQNDMTAAENWTYGFNRAHNQQHPASPFAYNHQQAYSYNFGIVPPLSSSSPGLTTTTTSSNGHIQQSTKAAYFNPNQQMYMNNTNKASHHIQQQQQPIQNYNFGQFNASHEMAAKMSAAYNGTNMYTNPSYYYNSANNLAYQSASEQTLNDFTTSGHRALPANQLDNFNRYQYTSAQNAPSDHCNQLTVHN